MTKLLKSTDVKSLIVYLFLSNIALAGVIYKSVLTDIKDVQIEVKENRKSINVLAIQVAKIKK